MKLPGLEKNFKKMPRSGIKLTVWISNILKLNQTNACLINEQFYKLTNTTKTTCRLQIFTPIFNLQYLSSQETYKIITYVDFYQETVISFYNSNELKSVFSPKNIPWKGKRIRPQHDFFSFPKNVQWGLKTLKNNLKSVVKAPQVE